MNKADAYANALWAYQTAEGNLKDVVIGVVTGDPESSMWPCDDMSFDPLDWDGFSVEFKEAEPGWRPTPEQQEALWALGFTVIRVFHKDSKSVSGDWWQVRGFAEPKQCHCSRPRPTPAG